MKHAIVDKDTGKILGFFEVEDDAHAALVLVGGHDKVPLPEGHPAHACEVGDDFPEIEHVKEPEPEKPGLLDKIIGAVS